MDGMVLNIQRFCTHDGPGIRSTVFLKGCPLNCHWCHNPESQQHEPQVLLTESRCIHCDLCTTVCPAGPQTHDREFRQRSCTACGKCVDACPADARQLAGRCLGVAQVLDTVLRDRMFYEESGGGVTFSGGEPLTKALFLHALLEACHHHGLHTAVDTCGFAPWQHLEAIAPLTDLFLYDLKLLDDERHIYYTGVSNALILDNLKRLCSIHPHIWIRMPLIPGINDGPNDLQDAAAFLVGLPNIQRIDLLPYHAHGKGKFARLGIDYPMGDLKPAAPEALQQAADRFRRYGIQAHVAG